MKVGDAVMIRTVTLYYTGRIVAMDDRWIVLEDAAWVADMGRFHKALADGTLSEVEPFPDGHQVHVAIGAIVDVSPWPHQLPREVI